ncbi:hypothetical protein HMPREF9124_0271 [Oribacterium sp. oral taxon 108 str. F0425]|nr:hypothetical protein HMPREF9124_0271 [Oribacterium sp. oral taxon 108 str. F0425]
MIKYYIIPIIEICYSYIVYIIPIRRYNTKNGGMIDVHDSEASG